MIEALKRSAIHAAPSSGRGGDLHISEIEPWLGRRDLVTYTVGERGVERRAGLVVAPEDATVTSAMIRKDALDTAQSIHNAVLTIIVGFEFAPDTGDDQIGRRRRRTAEAWAPRQGAPPGVPPGCPETPLGAGNGEIGAHWGDRPEKLVERAPQSDVSRGGGGVGRGRNQARSTGLSGRPGGAERLIGGLRSERSMTATALLRRRGAGAHRGRLAGRPGTRRRVPSAPTGSGASQRLGS